VRSLSAMEAANKNSRVKIAMGMVAILAISCVAMYITSDAGSVLAEEEVKVTSRYTKYIGSGYDLRTPRSIESVDVDKAGLIVTNTPEGRMRLLTYLRHVESRIAKEVSGRRADITAIRAHMQRNFAINQAARRKMKQKLYKRMAANAHTCEVELASAMRKVQGQFAAAAGLANRRNNANLRRSRRTREIMQKNKRQAAYDLSVAVANHQRNLAALSQATNHKIGQTNKHIAANAALIKENAKAARRALNSAMSRFDHKVANVDEEAKKGRSKLAAQMAAQDKSFRMFAANRVRAIAASTAAQFRKVRAHMARDRHHADMMLKASTSRMNAALNANQALQDHRFAKTVSDIAAAKREAAHRVAAVTREFKVSLLKLNGVVRRQTAKLNSRVTNLAGVVSQNKLEQARVNRNSNAEMKRMMRLGNRRYKQHLKNDAELRRLMAKNKAASMARIGRMAASFNMGMNRVRKQMARDRAHASHSLKRATNRLYGKMFRDAAAQAKMNAALRAQTASISREAAASLSRTKVAFSQKLAKMNAIAVRSARRNQKKINHISGVIVRNQLKSARGRQMLHNMRKANRADISGAIANAVHLGEQRALKVAKHMKDLNSKTRSALNSRISTQISKLRKNTQRSLFALSLENKQARAQMKREVLAAVRSAAKNAKNDLKRSVAESTARMNNLSRLQANNSSKNARARARLALAIRNEKRRAVRSISAAVETQNRALLCLKDETAKKLKKTNRRLAGAAAQLARNARMVAAQMKANVGSLQSKIAAARRASTAGIRGFQSASVARYQHVLGSINKAMSKALKASNAKFAKVNIAMSKQRAHMDKALAGAVANFNSKLAERSALEDARFRKSVKNIAAARAAASRDVAFAKKAFATRIAGLTAAVKAQETRLSGEISVVSGEIMRNRASQARVNRRVSGELKHIVRVANRRHAASIRARGKLRKVMNANKKAAAAQVAALAKNTRTRVALLRAKMASQRRYAAKRLSSATRRLYNKMSNASRAQAVINASLKGSLTAARASAAAGIAAAKRSFNTKFVTLTSTIAANQVHFQKHLSKVTGVATQWQKSSARERALMKANIKSINIDTNRAISRSVQLGEARARRIQSSHNAAISKMKRGVMAVMCAKIEAAANRVFKTVQGKRHKIADNYLSLKAYAVTAKGKIKDYVSNKGKGRGLNSIGDLLTTVGALSRVKISKAQGLGEGAKKLPMPFGGKALKTKATLSKVNFLANEYVGVMRQVRERWPYGIGKYLLDKVDGTMQGSGILQVDKVTGKAGNFVFINGRSVGLSSKLSDFMSLGAKMGRYQVVLSKLTQNVGHKVKGPGYPGKMVYAKAPEWQGN
jgi:hypothetical protein